MRSSTVAGSTAQVPKYIWALFVAFLRAKILKDHYDKSRRRFDRLTAKARRESKDVPFSEFLRVLTFLELWLASLQVVVEGYRRSYRHSDSVLSGAEVDALLDDDHRRALKKFRNTVFHVELRDHPDARAVLDRYDEFTTWASRLTKELGRIIVHRAAPRVS